MPPPTRADAAEGARAPGSVAGEGPRRFFFVRHGETDWNREGRLQGQHDAPLNPLGRRQAAAAGVLLARLLAVRGLKAADLPFQASPLTRTRDTMDLVRAGLGGGLPPVVLDDRLKELGFGAWEGRTWDDLKRAEPAAVATRRRETWTFVPPGGESYAALLVRLSPWLAALGEDAVVVAHGGVARVLMHARAGVPPQRATAEDVHQGRVLVFDGAAAEWA